jgi:hypothetical protein
MNFQNVHYLQAPCTENYQLFVVIYKFIKPTLSMAAADEEAKQNGDRRH